MGYIQKSRMTSLTTFNVLLQTRENSLLNNSDTDLLLSALEYNIIGVFFALLSLLGFLGNGCALMTFISTKSLHSATNLFIMALCVCDLLMALCSVISCSASFHHGWVYSDTICFIEGFSAYFLGLTSMYLLAAISLDRYVVIVRPLCMCKVNKRIALIAISVCCAAGCFWAALPLAGWNHYTTEGVEISCSVEWYSQNSADTYYIISIFIFCLIVPLCLMIFSYLAIYITIRNTSANSAWSANSRMARNKQRMERTMLKTAFVLVAVYIFSWLPYTVVSFMSAFGSPGVISPLMATLPALVAKSSGLWNPLIYAVTNVQFRKAFLTLYRCKPTDSPFKTKEQKTTSYSMSVTKTPQKQFITLTTTKWGIKTNLIVASCIVSDASTRNTSTSDISPCKSALNEVAEIERPRLSDSSPKQKV